MNTVSQLTDIPNSPPADGLQEERIPRIVVVSQLSIIKAESGLPQLQHHMYLHHSNSHKKDITVCPN